MTPNVDNNSQLNLGHIISKEIISLDNEQYFDNPVAPNVTILFNKAIGKQEIYNKRVDFLLLHETSKNLIYGALKKLNQNSTITNESVQFPIAFKTRVIIQQLFNEINPNFENDSFRIVAVLNNNAENLVNAETKDLAVANGAQYFYSNLFKLSQMGSEKTELTTSIKG